MVQVLVGVKGWNGPDLGTISSFRAGQVPLGFGLRSKGDMVLPGIGRVGTRRASASSGSLGGFGRAENVFEEALEFSSFLSVIRLRERAPAEKGPGEVDLGKAHRFAHKEAANAEDRSSSAR